MQNRFPQESSYIHSPTNAVAVTTRYLSLVLPPIYPSIHPKHRGKWRQITFRILLNRALYGLQTRRRCRATLSSAAESSNCGGQTSSVGNSLASSTAAATTGRGRGQ